MLQGCTCMASAASIARTLVLTHLHDEYREGTAAFRASAGNSASGSGQASVLRMAAKDHAKTRCSNDFGASAVCKNSRAAATPAWSLASPVKTRTRTSHESCTR